MFECAKREIRIDVGEANRRALVDDVRELSLKLPSDAMFLEVGTREGHSAIITLDAIKESHRKRWFFTIDPHGHRPYRADDTGGFVQLDYGEQMYRNAMLSLHNFAFKHDLNYCHYRMTSDNFIQYAENIEFWQNGQPQPWKFGYVYLDGEHNPEPVLRELNWYKQRLVPGGVIVIDDATSLCWKDKESAETYCGVKFFKEADHKLFYKHE